MRIERRSYSRSPWRLITSDGLEVTAPRAIDHPTLGTTAFNESVCGETKAECTAKALALLEFLISKTITIAPLEETP